VVIDWFFQVARSTEKKNQKKMADRITIKKGKRGVREPQFDSARNREESVRDWWKRNNCIELSSQPANNSGERGDDRKSIVSEGKQLSREGRRTAW